MVKNDPAADRLHQEIVEALESLEITDYGLSEIVMGSQKARTWFSRLRVRLPKSVAELTTRLEPLGFRLTIQKLPIEGLGWSDDDQDQQRRSPDPLN